MLSVVWIVFNLAQVEATGSFLPSIDEVQRIPVDHLLGNEREVVENSASFVQHNDAYFLAYGNNLFKFPDFPESFEYEVLPLPESSHIQSNVSSGYGFILNKAGKNLYLSVGAASPLYNTAEAVKPRLFLFKEEEGWAPIDTGLIVFYPNYGYSHLSINWLGSSGEKLFTSAGGNLTVSPEPDGPYDFLYSLGSEPDEVFGFHHIFLDDQLVIIWGTSAINEGVFLRGLLNSRYDGWLQEPPDQMPDELTDGVLTWQQPLGGGIFSLERQYGTGDLWGGQSSKLFRSRDNGLSLEKIEGFGLDWLVEEDPTVSPVIRQIVFPTTHADHVLIGGHENYRGRHLLEGRAFLSWSQNNGVTWETLTTHIEDWNHGMTPIVFLHETEGGELFAGRIISRTADEEGPFLEILRIILPDPARLFLPEARLSRRGWRESSSMGWINTGFYPWVWLDEQQVWIHVIAAAGGFWAYDQELGYYFTSGALFPHIYSPQFESYLFILRESGPDRWIYSYSDQQWFQL
jgi:hypothetical protein